MNLIEFECCVFFHSYVINTLLRGQFVSGSIVVSRGQTDSQNIPENLGHAVMPTNLGSR